MLVVVLVLSPFVCLFLLCLCSLGLFRVLWCVCVVSHSVCVVFVATLCLMLIQHEGVFVAPLLPNTQTSAQTTTTQTNEQAFDYGVCGSQLQIETMDRDFAVFFVPNLHFPARKNLNEKTDRFCLFVCFVLFGCLCAWTLFVVCLFVCVVFVVLCDVCETEHWCVVSL